MQPSSRATKLFIFAFIALGANLATAGTMSAASTHAPLSEQRWMAAGNLGRALPSVREGDVIFIRVRHALYRRIAETSGSWESHVGIILRNHDGAWMVAESTIPVSRFTPLARFVGRSENGRFLIRRLRDGVSEGDVRRLHVAAGNRMGKLYDTGFNYDSPRQYCSKFVFDCFHEAVGRPVGKLETFSDMLAGNPGAPVAFWRAWFLGRIPWERRCVTTASQLHAPNMVTVFDSKAAPDEEAR